MKLVVELEMLQLPCNIRRLINGTYRAIALVLDCQGSSAKGLRSVEVKCSCLVASTGRYSVQSALRIVL